MALDSVRGYMGSMGVKVSVDEWTIRRLRVEKTAWSEEEFALFIRDHFHLHLFFSHPHQGGNGLDWNAETLYKQLRKHLYFRPGFPCGEQMFCPIWTQHKILYLQSVPELVIATEEINFFSWLKHTQEKREDILNWYV
jgi:hypothetical protein